MKREISGSVLFDLFVLRKTKTQKHKEKRNGWGPDRSLKPKYSLDQEQSTMKLTNHDNEDLQTGRYGKVDCWLHGQKLSREKLAF